MPTARPIIVIMLLTKNEIVLKLAITLAKPVAIAMDIRASTSGTPIATSAPNTTSSTISAAAMPIRFTFDEVFFRDLGERMVGADRADGQDAHCARAIRLDRVDVSLLIGSGGQIVESKRDRDQCCMLIGRDQRIGLSLRVGSAD